VGCRTPEREGKRGRSGAGIKLNRGGAGAAARAMSSVSARAIGGVLASCRAQKRHHMQPRGGGFRPKRRNQATSGKNRIHACPLYSRSACPGRRWLGRGNALRGVHVQGTARARQRLRRGARGGGYRFQRRNQATSG